MGRKYISRSTNKSFASIGGKDHGGSHGGLEEGVEIGEAFDIEHVNLVNENDTRDNLCNALVNIAFDNFVDLSSKFIGDFRPATLDETAHDTHNILATLWSSVCSIKIAEG